jgi:hypothetical protein
VSADGNSNVSPSEFMQAEADSIDAAEVAAFDGTQAEADALNRRALELAKAHHAAMGPAMRATGFTPPGASAGQAVVVTDWYSLPVERRNVMVAAMRELLLQGVIA